MELQLTRSKASGDLACISSPGTSHRSLVMEEGGHETPTTRSMPNLHCQDSYSSETSTPELFVNRYQLEALKRLESNDGWDLSIPMDISESESVVHVRVYTIDDVHEFIIDERHKAAVDDILDYTSDHTLYIPKGMRKTALHRSHPHLFD